MNFVERRELLRLIEKLVVRLDDKLPHGDGPVIWKTKSGHDVEILHTNADMNYPIVGLFIDRTLTGPQSWRADGGFAFYGDHPLDLIIPDGFNIVEVV